MSSNEWETIYLEQVCVETCSGSLKVVTYFLFLLFFFWGKACSILLFPSSSTNLLLYIFSFFFQRQLIMFFVLLQYFHFCLFSYSIVMSFVGSSIVTLLPGSRLQEVRRMLPIYAEVMQLLKESFPDLSCVIPIAPNRQVQAYIDKAACSFPIPTVLVPGVSLETKYIAFNVSLVVSFTLVHFLFCS